MKKGASWNVIALLLVFLFPVGVILLIHKMCVEPYQHAANGRALQIIGWAIASLGPLYLVMALTGQLQDIGENMVSSVLIMLVFFGGIGAVLIVPGIRSSKRAKLFAKYRAVVLMEKDLTVSHLATCFGTDTAQALTQLERMVREGVFGPAYIDYMTGELVVIPPLSPAQMVHMAAMQANAVAMQANIPADAQAQLHWVYCTQCGAPNQLTGKEKKPVCNFCGMLLNDGARTDVPAGDVNR